MERQETFHRFTHLPYDLRHYIYALATPCRIVRVEEGPVNVKEKGIWHENYYDSYFHYAFEQFCKQMLEDAPTFNIKLHPDLACFAHNWRHRIPWSAHNHPYQQKRLDAYGFTSSLPFHEPWQASTDVPLIPTDWLIDYPELAFELTRKCCLYGHAEIPVFLHVCIESRQALIRWGYRLFFSTRTAGPRTWFHPGRDSLYIPYQNIVFPRDREYRSRLRDQTPIPTPYPCIKPGMLLSGCHWDIGQYSVQDLKEVKYLILGTRSRWDEGELAGCLENILPLISNLEELLLEDWSLQDFVSWFDKIEGSPCVETSTASSVACIPAEDIDAIGCFYWTRGDAYNDPPPMSFTGHSNARFNRFKTLSSNSYHEAQANALEAQLLRWSSTSTTAQDQELRIPTIRHVHLCPESCSKLFTTSRHGLWKALQSLDSDYIRQPDFRTKFLTTNDFQPPFNIQWRDIEHQQREWPELIEFVRSLGVEAASTNWAEWSDQSILQAWYLNRFAIAEPRSTIS
ncbi:hypothetical protein FSARC_13314 [Fusarium sarcochroum]|uniref:2EXR domain-containing protein n=1 Tax=Fusarium sarcochroum TaxID=1208366 RepID=A0A8H4T2B1_9HYPO|nr:hypothetical protein FSARC_13314 [Fusarium sarcochroum]